MNIGDKLNRVSVGNISPRLTKDEGIPLGVTRSNDMQNFNERIDLNAIKQINDLDNSNLPDVTKWQIKLGQLFSPETERELEGVIRHENFHVLYPQESEESIQGITANSYPSNNPNLYRDLADTLNYATNLGYKVNMPENIYLQNNNAVLPDTEVPITERATNVPSGFINPNEAPSSVGEFLSSMGSDRYYPFLDYYGYAIPSNYRYSSIPSYKSLPNLYPSYRAIPTSYPSYPSTTSYPTYPSSVYPSVSYPSVTSYPSRPPYTSVPPTYPSYPSYPPIKKQIELFPAITPLPGLAFINPRAMPMPTNFENPIKPEYQASLTPILLPQTNAAIKKAFGTGKNKGIDLRPILSNEEIEKLKLR